MAWTGYGGRVPDLAAGELPVDDHLPPIKKGDFKEFSKIFDVFKEFFVQIVLLESFEGLVFESVPGFMKSGA